MKLCIAMLFLALFTAAAAAQATGLPEILVPDESLRLDAEQSRADVFRLLPLGMFKDAAGSYKDEDNPLGLRGGGAFYSFTKRSHSYNRIPQIELDGGMLKVGFYGPNYGFMYDLGAIPLFSVSEENEIVKALIDYAPPKLNSEIGAELRRVAERKTNAHNFSRRLRAQAGNTYLLRAISFNEADKLVAFQILKKDENGSITIAWKSLKDFETPSLMEKTASRK